MSNRHFEEYSRRTMSGRKAPDWMKEGAPPPASWLGEPAEWVALKEQATAAWSLRPILDFAEAIVRGWRPHELASGELDRGAQIRLLDGSVCRSPAMTDPVLRGRALAVLQQARRAQVKLDPITMVDLEAMAAGSWGARGGEAKVEAAERQLSEAETAHRVAAAEQHARPVISVPRDFRALGRSFPAGTYQIDPAALQELQGWQSKLEAQAASHGWESPAGFERRDWPPYRVLGGGSANPAQSVTVSDKAVFA